MIRQVSVFMQNQEGRLGRVLRTLADAGVNIRSLTIAETADFGLLRLILQDTDAGMAALKKAGFMANETKVLAVEVPDEPGGMADIVEVLGGADISVSYAYSFLPKNTDNAIIILKVPEEDREKAIDLFTGDDRTNLLARDELLTR
ncbi:MAG: ACT domain-containing protein [Pseudoramibacter sp.]|jgi:hypothetical protein